MHDPSSIERSIQKALQEVFMDLYKKELAPDSFQLKETPKGFDGEITLILFELAARLKCPTDELGNALGTALLKCFASLVSSYSLVKGFLNLRICSAQWLAAATRLKDERVSQGTTKEKHPSQVVIEYASPNTNKPLHLGHMRNIFIGDALSRILKDQGDRVRRVSLVNDRGIHICKSMLAYLKEGNHETPTTPFPRRPPCRQVLCTL